MTFDLSTINWLAVIVGAVIYFALGALWYSPVLFARAWQRSIGWDPERRPPEQRVTTYLVPFIGYLVMAIGTGLLAAATGTDTLAEGVVLGRCWASDSRLPTAWLTPISTRTSRSRGPGSRSRPVTTPSAC